MAVKIEAQVDNKPALEALAKIAQGFLDISKLASLNEAFKLDDQLIKAQFEVIRINLEKALATGNLDIKTLGFDKLITYLSTVIKGAAKLTGQEFNSAAVIPIQEGLAVIDKALNDKESRLSQIYEEQKSLGQEAVKKSTKEEVGFTGRVMAGSLSEAKTLLKELQAAEEEDPGGNERRWKLIEFYELYVRNLEVAADKARKLKAEEAALTGETKALDVEKQKLELKLKQESANIDKEAPGFLVQLMQVLQEVRNLQENIRNIQKDSNKDKKEANKLTEDASNKNKQEADSLGAKTAKAFEYYAILNMLKTVYRDSIRTITELDKAMTDAAIVTDMNKKEAWALLETYQALATETGLRVSELSGVVNEFLKQGRNLKDALELAEIAAKSAKVAGISALEAVKYLTSAVNGFGLAADQAEMIADKFAAIAARSASDFEELAVAMSKVAPTAQSAGVGIDFMMGVLAKGLETTREAPENIGTAFKTIFARMREVTDIGKATEDGMSLNRVEKALASINVPLRDVTGQFRNLEDVLIDVGNKWDTLTTIEQAYLATALAGTRQQPRLLAIFNDFARTKELIQISADATGELSFQHLEYMTGMEYAMNELKNSWQGFITALASSELIIGTIQFITQAVKALSTAFKLIGENSLYTGIALTALIIKLGFSAALFVKNAIVATASGFANLFFGGAVASAGAAASGATPAVAGLSVAVNSLIWPFTLIAVVIGLVVAGILMFAYSVNEAKKGASKFGDKIDQLNAKLAELKTKQDSLDTLVDRFKELNKQTTKSIEDLEEINSLSDELSEFKYTPSSGTKKGKEQTFELVTTDFAGNKVINQQQLNELNALLEADRIAAEKQRDENFRKALKDYGIEAFENASIADYAKKIGYDAGVGFINSFTDATEESSKKAKKSLEDALRNLDMSMFYKTKYKIGNKEFDTLEEANNWLSGQTITKNLFGQTFVKIDGQTFSAQIQEISQFMDEEAKKMSESLSKIFIKFYSDLEKATIDLDGTAKANTVTTLQAGITQFNNAIQEARRIYSDPVELKAALEVIYASLSDFKIINDLVTNRKIDIDLIANLTLQGLDATAIQNYLNTFNTETLNAGNFKTKPMSITEFLTKTFGSVENAKIVLGPGSAVYAFYQQYLDGLENIMSKRIQDTIEKATSGEAGQISIGIQEFAQALRDAGYTEEQVQAEVIKLTNIIKTVNSEIAAATIKTQLDTAKNLFELTSQMAKGDFSKYTELAAEYGAGIVDAFIRGEEGAAQAFFEAQIQKNLNDINLAIEELQALRSIQGEEFSNANQSELSTLEAMADYYEQIALYNLMRNYRLEEAKSLLEMSNQLLKIQNSLLDMGITSGVFVDFLTELNSEFRSLADARLGSQLQADLDRLLSFGTEQIDGSVFFNVDEIDTGALRSALDNYMGTLNQYIEMQQQSFNQYKKTIEQTYKAEIDAVKNAVDEKWKQIDYANKLAEAEEKVLLARKNLAALQISGAGTSALRMAEKELKRAEEERRRMIEQQMAAEAQKQLEAERDALIQTRQQEMVTAIGVYTNQVEMTLTEVANLFRNNINTFTPPLLRNTQTIEDQIDATTTNTAALNRVAEAIEQQNITRPTTIARGSGFVDAGIFLGIS